jgi:alpha-L-fucosidase
LAGVPYDGNDPRFVDLYLEKSDEKGPYLPKNAPDSWKQTWLARTKDLVDKYHPDLLYFDGGAPFGEIGLEMMAYYYNQNQNWHAGRFEAVLTQKKSLNFRSGAFQEGTSVRDLERSKLEALIPEPWQTDTSIGPWFYRRGAKYETPDAIIDMFVDIVAKNGNLLLNVPLRADGTLDAAAENILGEMAKWTAVNGEAIYGTRPWKTYGEGPTVVKEGYSEKIKEAFTSSDIRFTTKGQSLYAICLDWPADGGSVKVKSLSGDQKLGEIADVSLLGHRGPVKWMRDTEGLIVILPKQKTSDYAFVLKVTFKK